MGSHTLLLKSKRMDTQHSDMAVLDNSGYFIANSSTNSNSNVVLDNFDAEWEDAMWQLVKNDFEESLLTLSETTTIVMITLYIPIFITSLVGNVLVLLVIVPNRRMWSVTNNFLVNLAVADLLVTLLCVPLTLAGKVYRQWVYGEVVCKLTPYLQGVAVTASTFTITAMSLDRCLAILQPMKFRKYRTTRHARLLILFVWLTGMLLMIPLLFVNQTQTTVVLEVMEITLTTCAEDWSSLTQRRAYDLSLLCIICILPAQIVFVSYLLMGKRLWVTDSALKDSQSEMAVHSGSCSEKNGGTDAIRANRRHVAKMCIVVSVVFVVCWLPYYTVNIYLDFKRDKVVANIVHWGLLIGHLHCITNPILYCFMHKTFRHCVRRLLPCTKTRLIRAPSGYGTAYNSTFRTKRCQSGRQNGTSLKRLTSSDSNKSNESDNANLESDSTLANGCIKNKTNSRRRVKLILSKLRDNNDRKEPSNKFLLVEIGNDSAIQGVSSNLNSRL